MTRLLKTATAALLMGGLLVSGYPAAQADPLTNARAKAAALREKVDALQHRAAIAIEEYDEAYVRLGVAVTAHLSAKRDLEAAQQSASATDDVAARRVRALYMSGGAAVLYAKVLDSGSVTEVAERLHRVDVVLGSDEQASRAAANVVVSRAEAERRLELTAARSTALQKVVGAKADTVEALLAEAAALLAAADARVVELAEQQRQAAATAAGARGREAIERARALLGNIPDVPPTQAAAAAIEFAKAQIGKPYVWGATGPDSYDCSGLTGAAYRSGGVHLPRTSRQQWYAGPHVALGALLPGDLLFWADDLSNPGTIHHVSLYVGGGMMIAAPQTGDVVKVQEVYLNGYIGAVRPS